jgi:hypothetical protein
MRNVALGLLGLFAVVLCAVTVAGTGLGVAAGGAAGILVIGGVALLGTSTDRLMGGAVGILMLTITWNGFRAGGGAVGDLFLVAAFATVVVSLLVEHRWPVVPPWLAFAGITFLLAGLLAGIFPESHALSAQTNLEQESLAIIPGYLPARSNTSYLLKFEIAVVLTPLLIAAAATTRTRVIRLLDIWTIGCVINAAVGVLDIAGLHLAPHALAGHRSSGLTIHPNYLALTALMGTPTAMIWLGRSRRWTIAGAISVLLLIGGAYASGSRDGIVTVAGAIIVTAFAVPRFRRVLVPALPLLLGAVAAVFVLVLMFTKLGSTILQHIRLSGNDASASGSNLQRTTAAHVAFVQIGARPVEGVGFAVIEDAQDIYLQILAAGGVIAGVGFIAYVGGLLTSSWRAWRLTPRDEVVAVTVIVISWLVNGIFDSQLADKYVYVIPGILIAMAAGALARDDVPAAEEQTSGEQRPDRGEARLPSKAPLPAV